MVKGRQLIEIPEFSVLRGEEAIWPLLDFINEVEEDRSKGWLTKKQAKALIKLANGLISSIEAEMRSGTSDKDIKETRFLTHLKKTVEKHVPESVNRVLHFV